MNPKNLNNIYQSGYGFTDRSSMLNAWAEYFHRNCQGRPDVMVIPVYSADLKTKVGERELAGAHVFSIADENCARIVRLFPDEDKLTQKRMEGLILNACERVKEARPDLKLTTVSDNWLAGKGRDAYVDLLFTTAGYGEYASSPDFARAKLWFRIHPQKSRCWGWLNTAIVSGGFMKEYDGSAIMKRSALKFPVHTTIWQWTGYKNLKDFHNARSLVIKGMVKLMDDSEFAAVCRAYRLNPDEVDVVVPEITCKFHSGEKLVKVEYYTHSAARVRNRMAVSLQALSRLPLTEYGKEVVYATYSAILKEIGKAYGENARKSVYSLMDPIYKNWVTGREEDDEDDLDWLKERAESLSATMVSLMFLPVKPDWFVNKTARIIFEKMLKKIYVPGITAKAMPNWMLKEGEIIVPRWSGMEIGERTTNFRSPNTGIEAFEATVVGHTDDPCVYLNPRIWAERCSGDFDGDNVAVLALTGIVDIPALETQKSTKSKDKHEKKLYEYIAMQSYIKIQAITDADRYTTQTIERNGDKEMARTLQQEVIDGLKHKASIADISLLAEKAFPGVGLNVPSIYQVLRGRFGSKERNVLFRYNEIVDCARIELSNVEWISRICGDLFYILAPSKSLITDGKVPSSHKAYSAIARRLGFEQLSVPVDTDAPRFDRNTVNSVRRELEAEFRSISANTQAVTLAVRIHGAYNTFRRMLEVRDVEPAYAYLRTILSFCAEHPATAGDALRYLWIAITLRKQVPGINSLIWGYNLFAYMPVVLGTWNIARESERLGGAPEVDVNVVWVKDIVEE